MAKDQDQLDQFVAGAVTKAEPDGFTKAEADDIKKQSVAQVRNSRTSTSTSPSPARP